MALLSNLYNGPKRSFSKRHALFAALLLFIIVFSICHRKNSLCSVASGFHSPPCSAILSATRVHQNIAIASDFGFHYDVYLAVAWTLERVMKGRGSVQVYADTPYFFNFSNMSDELGLYHGSFKKPAELIPDIQNSPIDMVIFGTCEMDVRNWQDELLAAWDARPAGNKFTLVCIVHDQRDDYWHHLLNPWARRNSVRILPIAEHVAEAFRTEFKNLSDSLDPNLGTAGYDVIPVDTHVPIFNLPNLPDKSTRKKLSTAAIQGSFGDRRVYDVIFQDLNRSLHENPASWGYLPLGAGPSFVPDPDLAEPSFKLHLVGHGWLDLPPELKNIVTFHVDLDYSAYYDVMADLDICVPAFGPLDGYYARQASSTVAMCMQVNDPILGTRRFRESYTYTDDDRVTITRPAVMSEIDALKALRTGDASDFLASDPSNSGIPIGSNVAVRKEVEQMITKGWVRTKTEFDDVKRGVWAANELVVMKMLANLR